MREHEIELIKEAISELGTVNIENKHLIRAKTLLEVIVKLDAQTNKPNRSYVDLGENG